MNLPKRYALSVEVKLVELPNQFQEPEERLSDDPMKAMVGMLQKVGTPIMSGMPYQQPAGFDFRKACSVTVQNFSSLAKIIEQYDELTRQIESERP